MPPRKSAIFDASIQALSAHPFWHGKLIWSRKGQPSVPKSQDNATT